MIINFTINIGNSVPLSPRLRYIPNRRECPRRAVNKFSDTFINMTKRHKENYTLCQNVARAKFDCSSGFEGTGRRGTVSYFFPRQRNTVSTRLVPADITYLTIASLFLTLHTKLRRVRFVIELSMADW